MEPRPNLESGLSSKSSSKRLGFYFLTLFPEMIQPALGASLLAKAQHKGLASFETIQIRDFARDRHRTVDDTPYGGGAGMLLKVDVLYDAWKFAHDRAVAEVGGDANQVLTVLLSPQGPCLDQSMARELSQGFSRLILVCGHYEGVDERFIELCVDRELSIGDYVLTGGELPALVVADVVTRLIPGVVGNEQSVSGDSLENNMLKYPQYTRPKEFMGLAVPQVLTEGDHGAIAGWREHHSRQRTGRKRPDLLKK
ncbi:MAG: tRNA (guanosine(37)-N1)-methyltransferase TrmD [Oligoflexia bacterium]|nr:tRNA (guanosine(37)-N1)-methyltransferase TrmD [Oligoflexia bacterium]